MTVDSRQLRSERHVEIGSLIQRDRGIVIDRWRRRAVEEQPKAKRVHLDVLLDQFDNFLLALGSSLAEAHDFDTAKHRLPALEHGEQRWETGWSLPELIRDYQLLRMVLLEYLDETLERRLRCHEVMAIGLALDEAIAASAGMYVNFREGFVRQTERERAEREKQAEEDRLRQRAEALHEENRRKDEFLATLGHELRNPLAPIRNAVHVLHMREPDQKTLEWAKDVVERQVRHMTRLVDELLEITRIARGKIQLDRQPLDLAALLRAAVADHHTALEEARLTLHLQLPAEPVLVLGDAVRLNQIVGNLIHNALKFTDSGGEITVALAVDPEKQRAAVTVRDTGIGIEAPMLPRLFETFAQADHSLHRSRGGLGLGLALVKGLVELHGGEVQAASDGPGRGSAFTFWLPLGQGAPVQEAPAAAAQPAAKTLRILVIDDNHDSADSAQKLLQALGHEVAVAYSGQDGVETASQFRPEVVLCDLQLPGMDGYAVARALRQNPALAGCRLIAVSGYGREEDRHRSLEAGFDHHMTKPVEPDELWRLLTPE
jgi:signal transduction histidine kinase